MDLRHVAAYWGRFDDNVPKGMRVELTGFGWTVHFPNGASQDFVAGAPRAGWNPAYRSDANTTRLWLRSLRYVPCLLKQGRLDFAVDVASDFDSHLQTVVNDPETVKSGSLDHQCALQLRTLCELIAYATGSMLEFESVVELCRSISSKILHLIEYLDLLQPNNHGIMLAISLLHSSEIIGLDGSQLTRQEVELFLFNSLRGIFGDDGVVNENTVMYQALYMDLLNGLQEYYLWSIYSRPDNLRTLMDTAISAYRRMLLPDHSLPPLGDGCRSFQSKTKAITGGLTSIANGLHVWSNSSTYFSFICGYRGVFHKQMDDSSIYLAHAGKTLLNDAGLGSYDQSDVRATAIRSQLGHSGLFFTDFDSVSPGEITSWGSGKRLVDAKMIEVDGHPGDVAGLVKFRSTRARRLIRWKSATSFEIDDRVHSSGESREAVSRFVFDPDANVDRIENGFLVRNGSSWARLEALPDPETGGKSTGILYTGDDLSAVDREAGAGHVARRPYEIVPSSVVEFPLMMVRGYGANMIRVSFGCS